MAAPNSRVGTRSPRVAASRTLSIGARTIPGGNKNPGAPGGKTSVGSKGSNPKGHKKKRKGKSSFSYDLVPLNPEFDPRMRSIGSPLNGSSKIKRGWVQSEEKDYRVNFLFNPSDQNLVVSGNDAQGTEASMPEDQGGSNASYVTGIDTGVSLLYDRTYELFSPDATGKGKGFANRFGVYADVAAWYVFLGMLPQMPTSWQTSIILEPAKITAAYLFVGPKLIYYGNVTGIDVTYSHWTQNMIPSRCAVRVGFQILPFGDRKIPGRGKYDAPSGAGGANWDSPDVPLSVF